MISLTKTLVGETLFFKGLYQNAFDFKNVFVVVLQISMRRIALSIAAHSARVLITEEPIPGYERRNAPRLWFVPLLLLAGIVPIGLSLALIGHATDRNGLRNTGNIILYPFVAVIPVADIALVVSESPSLDFHYLFALTTGAATGTGLVLATAGQISGHHRMRNSGNFTYLGGIILQTLFGLKFIL